MAKGMIRLQEELHFKILSLRSIETVIRRPEFERLWDDSSEEQREELQQHINNADKDKVREWMAEHPSLDLMEKKLSDLQKIAYRLGVKNYSRLGKLELVQAIKTREEKYGTQQSISA